MTVNRRITKGLYKDKFQMWHKTYLYEIEYEIYAAFLEQYLLLGLRDNVEHTAKSLD